MNLLNIETWNDASDGITILFNLNQFAEVASIIKPKHKRKVREYTAEERAKLAAMGVKYRFSAGLNAANLELDCIPIAN